MNIILPIDIQRHRYPLLADFDLVADQLRTVIEDNPAFIGGLIAGSYSLSQPIAFSDLDGIGLYHDELEHKAIQGARLITKVAAAHHVPITHFRFIRLSEAMGGEHTVTKSFRAHLTACQNTPAAILKAPILHHFSQHPDSLAQNALDYILHKLHKLRRLVIADPQPWTDDWISMVDECLSTTFYCAWRTLEAIKDTTLPADQTSRQDIIRDFQGLISSGQLPFNQYQRPWLRLVSHRDRLSFEYSWPDSSASYLSGYQSLLLKVAAMSQQVYAAIAHLYGQLKQIFHPAWQQSNLRLT